MSELILYGTMKKISSMPLQILQKVQNSLCTIIINNEDKGKGFFLKFKNEFNFEINLLVTTANLISLNLINSKQEIQIMTESNKSCNIILKSDERIIKLLEKENISAIEIMEEEREKLEANFLLCDLNYIDETYRYKNQNAFIFSTNNTFFDGKITDIIKLKKFKFISKKYDLDKKYFGSPIISKETGRVIGIYIKNKKNEKFGAFIGDLRFSFMNSDEIKRFGTNFEIKNLKIFSKFICKITNFGNIEENGFFIKINEFNLLITSSNAFEEVCIEIMVEDEEFIIEINEEERLVKKFDKLGFGILEILQNDEIMDFIEFLPIITENHYNKYLDKNNFLFKNAKKTNNIKLIDGKIIGLKDKKFFELSHWSGINKINNKFGISPIVLIENLEVIGIKTQNNSNIAIFSRYLFEKFEKFLKGKLNINNNEIINDKKTEEKNLNIIKIIYKKNKKEKIRIFGDEFVERNKKKCVIMVNGKQRELCTHINEDEFKEDKFNIELIEKETITDMSYMFSNCSSLIYLPNISNWNMKNVVNISFIFSQCSSLRFNIEEKLQWDTSNFKNIEGMFNCCSSLQYIPNISYFDTKNIIDMNSLFYNCNSLVVLSDISKWKIKNVKDISYMFYNCESLTELPNISEWKTENLEYMDYLFYNCSSLKYIPDISKWNIDNVININNLFSECRLLSTIPDISKWNTSNIIYMNNIFDYCSSLKELPDISNWDTSKVKDMSCMFRNCEILTQLPDISKWNTSNVEDMHDLFSHCSSLLFMPDISKWKTKKVKNMSCMFESCSSLSSFPDISKWDISNLENIDDIFKFSPNLSKYLSK